MKANIQRVMMVLLAGFLIIAVTLPYWQVIRSDELTGDARFNRYRLTEAEKSIKRGRILDREGRILAENESEEAGAKRRYSAPWLVGVTGYHSTVYGDTNIEGKAAGYLLGEAGLDQLKAAIDGLLHRPRIGSDVVLTLDAELQEIAEKAMAGSDGAAIVMQPQTGEILALVSHPYANPNEIDANWAKLMGDPSAPLLNRATQGLYVPGSTFKTLTLAAALDAAITDSAEVFDFEMKVDGRGRPYHTENVSGYEVYCANHGVTSPGTARLTLAEAYATSCNVAFARLGLRLGAQRYVEYAKRFGLESLIPFEIAGLPSKIGATTDRLNDRPTLAATSFGQGQLQVTPLQLAVIASTVARGGASPQPFVIKEIRSGEFSQQMGHQRDWQRVMSGDVARVMSQMMVESVETGWASGAKITGVKVAGKTGTAEVAPGQIPHALFIGFAPADDPVVAVAVVKENAGSGSTEAVPVAKRIIEAALEKYAR